ncbi:MAG: hypothetical protein A2039_01955 [Candidatus Melainabacteria bacterium GWA2_34_9]|nr:MAG: hypothetical protein A2039_01955 [Candidatus Melainabacteria bacterium GWA2_34_9]
MISYANTSMYQPGVNYSNYNSYGNGLSTGFSLSNYTDTSVFQGQNMNTGYYSQQCMAPQQQNSNEAFMQQLVLMLLSFALQKRNQPETTTITEETIIDTEEPAPEPKKDNHNHNIWGGKAAIQNDAGRAVAGVATLGLSEVFGGW